MTEIAVIGDRFMLPDYFVAALHKLPQAVALNLAKTKRIEFALPRQLLGCIIHA